MSFPATSILSVNSEAFETSIQQAVSFQLAATDDFYANTWLNNQGLIQTSQISQDYIVERLYRDGSEGLTVPDAARWSLGGGPSYGYQNKLALFDQTGAANSVFPNPNLSPRPLDTKLKVGMTAFLHQVSTSMAEKLFDKSPQSVTKFINEKAERVAHGIVGVMQQYLWSNGNENYRICTVASGGSENDSAVSVGAGPVMWFTTDNRSTARFYRGQLLEFLYGAETAASGVQLNEVIHDGFVFYVTDVDHTSNRVAGMFISTTDPSSRPNAEVTDSVGDTGISIAGSEIEIPVGSQVAPYGTRSSNASWGTLGVNDWYKKTGNLLGDNAIAGSEINVDIHSQFKSVIEAVNSPLSFEKFERYMDLFDSHHEDKGHMLDTFVTTKAVRRRMFNDMKQRYMALGMPTGVTGSDSGQFSYNMDGRTINFQHNRHIAQGELYGLKMGGQNWKRAQPDDLEGMRSDAAVPGGLPFRFIAESGGFPSNLIPIVRTANNWNEFTGNSYMPAVIRFVTIPEHPAGLKLTDIDEDRLFAS